MEASEKPAQVQTQQLDLDGDGQDESHLNGKQGNAADRMDMFRLGKTQELRVR